MKLDLTKIKSGSPIYLDKKNIVIDGIIRIKENCMITCLPNLSPYKELGVPNPWKMPYTYVDHKNAVDIQFLNEDGSLLAKAPIYAEADGTMYLGNSSGNAYFIANGKQINMSHLSKIYTGARKKGELIAYSGNVGTSNYHLHVYVNTNNDRSKDTILKIEYGGNVEEFKNYFNVVEDKEKTHRYFDKHAQYKMKCAIETGVYQDVKLTKKHDTSNFKPGQIVESNFHSTQIINGTKHWIHVIPENQHGKKVYFAYKKEL